MASAAAVPTAAGQGTARRRAATKKRQKGGGVGRGTHSTAMGKKPACSFSFKPARSGIVKPACSGDARTKSEKMGRLVGAHLAKTKYRKPACSGADEADIDLLVGPSIETDDQHCLRHGVGFTQTSLRCLVIRRHAEIARIAPWVSQQPAHLCATWRIGCRICAAGLKDGEVRNRKAAHIVTNAQTGRSKQAFLRCSLWEHFRFVEKSSFRVLQLRLKAHAASGFHRLSAYVFNSPQHLLAAPAVTGQPAAPMTAKAASKQELIARMDAVAESQAQPAAPGQLVAPCALGLHGAPRHIDTLDAAIGSNQDPLRGNFPQRQDWVHSWADSFSGQIWWQSASGGQQF